MYPSNIKTSETSALKLLTVVLLLILAVFLTITFPGLTPGTGEFVVYVQGQGESNNNNHGNPGGNQGAADDCRNCDCRTGTSYRLTLNWENGTWKEDEDGGPLEVNITKVETNDVGEPTEVNWSSSHYPVDCVIVESAGEEDTPLDACNNPSDSPATSGSVTSPATNDNNGSLKAISHISFCYDVTTGVDLAVEKTVDNPTPDKDSTVTFDVKLTNNGPDNATGVKIEDNLPTGLDFQSADPGGDYDSSSGVWNVGSINSESSATLEISAKATSYGKFTNTASLDLESLDDQTDLVSTNNQDSATVVVIGLTDTFPGNFDVTQTLLEENLGERCLNLGSFTVEGFDTDDYSLQAFYNIDCSGGTLNNDIIWIENQDGTSTACSGTDAGEYLSRNFNSPTGLNGPGGSSTVTYQTYLDLVRAANTNLPDSCSITINVFLASTI